MAARKGTLRAAVAAEVSQDVERQTGGPVDGLDFEVLEREVRKTAISTAASLVAARLNAGLSDGEAVRNCLRRWPFTFAVRFSCHERDTASAGRQDPDAEPTGVRVTDLTNGLARFEGVDSMLGRAKTGLGSPQSVALANPNAVEWPYPVPDARDDLVNVDCCVFSVPKLRRSLLVDV
ncbi:MAG: hypothetical protein OXI81_21950 [Paracoccaceae bacterium]|nr:hypothetical protein [Paracoccaceae bacterium]